MHYRQFVNGNKKLNVMASSSLETLCFRNPVNTLIPTSLKLKLFTSVFPTSQPSQNNAELAIRPKYKISSMLVLVPVIHKNK